MKNDAELVLIFYSFNNNSLYNKLIIDDEEFEIETETEKINKKFTFDKYEKDLGRKNCSYKLITKDDESVISGTFDISFGNHIGFCFLDEPGMTYKLLFLQKKEKMEDFMKNKYTLIVDNISCKNKKCELSLNRNDTLDRASLILINCMMNSQIKKDGETFIDLLNYFRNIKNYDKNYGYQICYHYDNFQDFAYQKMEEIKKVNFEKKYSENIENVTQMYNILTKILEKEDINEANQLIKDLMEAYRNNKRELKSIINKKYLCGKEILEKDLDKENYSNFIFMIISILFAGEIIENKENFNINDLKDIHKKLLENKNILDSDKNLKVYEKMFILIDIYISDLLYEKDYRIHYLHKNNIEKESPLYYAFEFLNNFIENLDYDSNFYYPLLSIDGGYFHYKYDKDDRIDYISTYGFNMLSLEMIKNHLKNLIPDVLLLSEYISDDNARTNPLNGNIFLNINKFKDVNIYKKGLDENKSKHYAFILAKILIHEIFGHKKSSFSKLDKDNSVISFRNELGELKLINVDDTNHNIFRDIIEISQYNKANNIKGDSGYFLEYFLGRINDEYTLSVIDTIEEKTNLSKLLDPKLWHKEISIFKEYLKLLSIFIFLFPEEKLDNNLTIYEQIKLMKPKLGEEETKLDEKGNDENTKIEADLNKIIDEKFKNIWKKRKNIKIVKRIEEQSPKKSEKKRRIDVKKFLGFTNGFYKK